MENDNIIIPSSIKRSAAGMASQIPTLPTAEERESFMDSVPPCLEVEAEDHWNDVLTRSIADVTRYQTQQSPQGISVPTPLKAFKPRTITSNNPFLSPKFTVGEAAQLTGLGQTNLRSFVAAGRIPVVKFGGKFLFLEKDLISFVAEHYGKLEHASGQARRRRCVPSAVRNSPLLDRNVRI